ncbi:uncharacterized protein [Watersipora subatra]|uniref:uncharacterized protein n=1 Tax=Watersipora subatra TaxID=2589382 RepID=UPI00355C203A
MMKSVIPLLLLALVSTLIVSAHSDPVEDYLRARAEDSSEVVISKPALDMDACRQGCLNYEVAKCSTALGKQLSLRCFQISEMPDVRSDCTEFCAKALAIVRMNE